ncbi:hypothetical protein NRB20_28730 [Nocardia sp. RB20]|uniref:Uncharacterized protein n=1 Tax=Nocardia macrotermitis TaxID=2585198 RepID=A0A7K0D258_9NOCA|nr:hypothetical protein [Nocardia macrotermitis]
MQPIFAPLSPLEALLQQISLLLCSISGGHCTPPMY